MSLLATRRAWIRGWLSVWGPAVAFVFALGVLELAVLHVPYKNFAWMVLIRNYGPAALHLVLALSGLAGLVAFVALARHSVGFARFLAFCIGSASLLYEYAYQQALERYSSAEDILIALFVSSAENKLDTAFTYGSPLALVAILGFAVAVWGREPIGPRATTQHWLAWAAAGLVWSMASWTTALNFPILSLPNTFRSAVSFGLMELFTHHGPRTPVTIQPSKAAARNLIFVVDEAVDAGHLSVNGYPRQTTPYLAALAASGRMKNWGVAVSGSTCSHAAGVLMDTGLRMDELPDRDDQVKKLPNLFQWAKAAGYRTYFLDGQMSSYWLGPALDMEYVDEWHPASEFGADGAGRHMVDIKIAQLAREILASGDRRFVFIWKAGLHYPYYRRFPRDSAPWTPYWTERTIRLDQLDALVNAYDNGILWSTDGFFRELMGPANTLPEDSVLLYTSDHGQALGRSGRTVSHCGTSAFEVRVPLMLLGLAAPVDESYRASHQDVFPTLLDLMGFEPPSRYGRSLLRARASDSKPRYFFGSDLSHGEPFPFDAGQR